MCKTGQTFTFVIVDTLAGKSPILKATLELVSHQIIGTICVFFVSSVSDVLFLLSSQKAVFYDALILLGAVLLVLIIGKED